MSTACPYTLGSGVLPERLYDTFSHEEHEYLVMCGGGGTTGAGIAGREDDPPIAMTNILGYIELDTGRRHGKRSNMRWDISAEEYKSKERPYKQHFTEGVIYRVKAFPVRSPELMSNEFKKGWLYVTEVLGACLSEPYLLDLLEEYNRPKSLHSDIFGDMPYNARRGEFETECDWLGSKISLRIYSKPDSEELPETLAAMERLYLERERWDREMRVNAAKTMTKSANEWLADYNYDAEEKRPPITEEAFAKNIKLSSILTYGGTEFTAYFDDGDMFFGHTIEVDADIEKGVESADLMG